MVDHWLGQWFLGALFVGATGFFCGVSMDLGWLAFSLVFGGVFGVLINEHQHQHSDSEPES